MITIVIASGRSVLEEQIRNGLDDLMCAYCSKYKG
jgi:hypothetical protein